MLQRWQPVPKSVLCTMCDVFTMGEKKNESQYVLLRKPGGGAVTSHFMGAQEGESDHSPWDWVRKGFGVGGPR